MTPEQIQDFIDEALSLGVEIVATDGVYRITGTPGSFTWDEILTLIGPVIEGGTPAQTQGDVFPTRQDAQGNWYVNLETDPDFPDKWQKTAPRETSPAPDEIIELEDGRRIQFIRGVPYDVTDQAPQLGTGEFESLSDATAAAVDNKALTGNQWQVIQTGPQRWAIREVPPAIGAPTEAGEVIDLADGRQIQFLGNQAYDVTTQQPLTAGEVVTLQDGRSFQVVGGQLVELEGPAEQPQITDVDGRQVFTGPGQLLPQDRPTLEAQAASAYARYAQSGNPADLQAFQSLNQIINAPTAFQQGQLDVQQGQLALQKGQFGLDVTQQALNIARSPGDWFTYFSRLYGRDVSQAPFPRAFEAVRRDLSNITSFGGGAAGGFGTGFKESGGNPILGAAGAQAALPAAGQTTGAAGVPSSGQIIDPATGQPLAQPAGDKITLDEFARLYGLPSELTQPPVSTAAAPARSFSLPPGAKDVTLPTGQQGSSFSFGGARVVMPSLSTRQSFEPTEPVIDEEEALLEFERRKRRGA